MATIDDTTTTLTEDNSPQPKLNKKSNRKRTEVTANQQKGLDSPDSQPQLPSEENVSLDNTDEHRKKIQSILPHLDSEQLQKILAIADDDLKMLETYRRQGSTLVKSRLDGLVIAALLIVGIVSDIFAKNEDQESFYFKLAIAIVVAVNQIDNCSRLLSIETVCGSFLAVEMIFGIVRQGLTTKGMKLHDDFKLLYAVLVLPMVSKNISWGTSIVFLLYICFNLWLANFIPAILAVVVVFFYQRGRFQVSRVNYERFYTAAGVAFLLIIFVYTSMYSNSKDTQNSRKSNLKYVQKMRPKRAL